MPAQSDSKSAQHDRDDRVGIKHRHVLGVSPFAPIKCPANEECQKTDKEHDGGESEPRTQQVARFGAQMRRAAFDEGHAAACLRAELVAARFLRSSEERPRCYDGFDTVERRATFRTAIFLDVGHGTCLHAVRRPQTRLVRSRGKTRWDCYLSYPASHLSGRAEVYSSRSARGFFPISVPPIDTSTLRSPFDTRAPARPLTRPFGDLRSCKCRK